MRLSFYTIDDLRLGHDPRGVSGWRNRSFLDIQDALAQYRGMSETAVKELGMTDGNQKLPLIRRVPLFFDAPASENVLVTDRLMCSPWRKNPEVLAAAQTCVARMKIRYCLDRGRLIPKPLPLPEDLVSYGPPAVRRAYVVGAGWMSPAELKRRFSQENGVFCYPLVLKYQVDVLEADGVPVIREVTPWELYCLESRTGVCVKYNEKGD